MDDHRTPHCHAIYNDYAGLFSIETGECLAGQMPPKQAKKIKDLDFIMSNKAELLETWNEL